MDGFGICFAWAEVIIKELVAEEDWVLCSQLADI